jgi:hypothetical protein
VALEQNMKINPILELPSRKVSKALHHGATHLLDEMAKKINIVNDIKICFPSTYKMILSLAYFLFVESGKPLYMANYFTTTHTHPCDMPLSSQQISKVLPTVTEDAKLKLFKLQTQRRLEN